MVLVLSLSHLDQIFESLSGNVKCLEERIALFRQFWGSIQYSVLSISLGLWVRIGCVHQQGILGVSPYMFSLGFCHNSTDHLPWFTVYFTYLKSGPRRDAHIGEYPGVHQLGAVVRQGQDLMPRLPIQARWTWKPRIYQRFSLLIWS